MTATDADIRRHRDMQVLRALACMPDDPESGGWHTVGAIARTLPALNTAQVTASLLRLQNLRGFTRRIYQDKRIVWRILPAGRYAEDQFGDEE